MNLKCEFEDRKCNLNQDWNNNGQCVFKNSAKHCVSKKDYAWNPSTSASEIDKYLKSYAYIKSH